MALTTTDGHGSLKVDDRTGRIACLVSAESTRVRQLIPVADGICAPRPTFLTMSPNPLGSSLESDGA